MEKKCNAKSREWYENRKTMVNWSLQCALLCFCVRARLFISCTCTSVVALDVFFLARRSAPDACHCCWRRLIHIFDLRFLFHCFWRTICTKFMRTSIPHSHGLYTSSFVTQLFSKLLITILFEQTSKCSRSYVRRKKWCRGQSWVFPMLVWIEWHSLYIIIIQVLCVPMTQSVICN